MPNVDPVRMILPISVAGLIAEHIDEIAEAVTALQTNMERLYEDVNNVNDYRGGPDNNNPNDNGGNELNGNGGNPPPHDGGGGGGAGLLFL